MPDPLATISALECALTDARQRIDDTRERLERLIREERRIVDDLSRVLTGEVMRGVMRDGGKRA